MAAIIWIVVSVVFGIIEAVTISLISIWMAVGAIAAAVAAGLGADVTIQLLVFAVTSFIMLFFTRPLARWLKKDTVSTNADRVIGEIGMVLETIDPIKNTGQIRVLGQIWSARSLEGDILEKDDLVQVVIIEGVKAIVKKAEK